MATEYGAGDALSLVAGETLLPFRFAAISSDGKLYLATGAGDEITVGVTTAGVAAGSAVAAVFTGLAKIESAEALTPGAPIVSDGFGRCANWVDLMSPTLGIAMAPAGGAGEIIFGLFTPRVWPIYTLDGGQAWALPVDASRGVTVGIGPLT